MIGAASVSMPRRRRPARRRARSARPRLRRGRRPRPRCATAPPTSRSPASALGERRSRSSTARPAARCPVPVEQLPVLPAARHQPDRHRQPARRARATSSRLTCPRCGGPARRETDTLDCHFDALWLWIPACVPARGAERPLRRSSRCRDLRHWLPSRAAGRRLRQRQLRLRPAHRHQGAARHRPARLPRRRRAVRRLPVPRDGDPRRAQDEQAPRQRGRPRRAGRALRRRHGAPRRALRRAPAALAQLERLGACCAQPVPARCGTTRTRRLAAVQARQERNGSAAEPDAEAGRRDTSEHLRAANSRNGARRPCERITEDMEELEMHSAVRNVMRLFDRIKDFEKRVLAREGELSAANGEALLEALAAARAAARPARPAHRRGAVDRLRARGGRRTDAVARRIVSGTGMSTIAPHREPPRRGPAADALVRDRPRLPPLRAPLPARGHGLRLPRLRQGPRHRLRLRARRAPLRGVPRSERPHNIWRFEELLPIVDASAQARVGQHAGYTPLIRADRLGAELGLGNLYLKDDSTSRPSLSYKDRVVAMSVARLLELRQGRDRLRLDRQRRHRRSPRRRQGRGRRLRLLPQPPRGHEGARLPRARREGLPGRGQLRRSQPPLPRTRR